MESKKDIQSYSTFTFEDFLQDDFFVESILTPTEETELFWKVFQEECTEASSEFHKAVRCIKDVNRHRLDSHNVEELWSNIRASNRRFVKRRFVRMGAWMAAASIALFFILRIEFFFPAPEIDDRENLREYVALNIRDVETAETQLILSDDRVISLPNRESVISYDSVSIRVGSPNDGKEEIAKATGSTFHQLIIPVGKRSVLTLSDGTEIWVNADTKLVYPAEFSADKREIFVDGEIYLDVQPDQDRPFIVRTVDMDVQVMGTEFNVQAYNADALKRVVLKSGAVKISSVADQHDTRLQPSYMYELNCGRKTVTKVDVDLHTSWVDEVYICDGERLDIMLTRLSRYYGKEIIADKRVAELRCNGKLNLKDDIDAVLKIISYIAPVKYTCEHGVYTITLKT
jgi:ferric-dicitrate binding protein FerR (iron transport regulator)